ncbi:hypothetical protein N9O63_00965 [Candidatus Pelagibacter sp.]|nr:hypothetical protein [Candidatus Pelagibacter sp.]
MSKYIIACSKKWFLKNSKRKFNKNFFFIEKKSQLNLNFLKKFNPKFIFFPHWSHIIPSKIFNKYNCILFHTSNLPYGRGGSPIQNLIKRKIYSSYICSFKADKILDAGPIYCKEKISLKGDLNNIFKNLSVKITKMIFFIIEKKPIPKKQFGKIINFKRLNEKDSKIKKNENMIDIYDKIRMLDNEDYPRAFIEYGKYKILFSLAKKNNNQIISQVEIKKK